ncbi:putative capsid protein [Pseudomonas phage Ep4]|uniref:Capsid protein n=1 Tax=Pseudomonas phage Ep4 TaxID=3057492 RepID=A0AAU9EAC4_9CAUD|nr:putative capsid protein [Pseudomonas phage Ep4]
MAQTPYAAAGGLTRPHWAGPNSDADIHLEVFDGMLDTAFVYNSFFRANSTFISVNDRSNTARIDRLGSVVIKGRQSGEALEATPVKNDKLVITVDTVTYARSPIDYQDDWTAPDFLPAIGQNHGTEHAKLFDTAHIIQLQKCRNWTAPAHLKPAFYDGKEYTAQLVTNDNAASAKAIIAAHAAGVQELITRDLGGSLNEFITLVSPRVFGILMADDKLVNVQYSDGNANYAQRRMAWMNGVRIVESARFPAAPITNHPLGTAFNVGAADVACEVLVYHPKMTLVTVEAKAHTSRVWDNEENFANVLDSYAMYTIGQRRPDTAFAVRLLPGA